VTWHIHVTRQCARRQVMSRSCVKVRESFHTSVSRDTQVISVSWYLHVTSRLCVGRQALSHSCATVSHWHTWMRHDSHTVFSHAYNCCWDICILHLKPISASHTHTHTHTCHDPSHHQPPPPWLYLEEREHAQRRQSSLAHSQTNIWRPPHPPSPPPTHKRT